MEIETEPIEPVASPWSGRVTVPARSRRIVASRACAPGTRSGRAEEEASATNETRTDILRAIQAAARGLRGIPATSVSFHQPGFQTEFLLQRLQDCIRRTQRQ